MDARGISRIARILRRHETDTCHYRGRFVGCAAEITSRHRSDIVHRPDKTNGVIKGAAGTAWIYTADENTRSIWGMGAGGIGRGASLAENDRHRSLWGNRPRLSCREADNAPLPCGFSLSLSLSFSPFCLSSSSSSFFLFLPRVALGALAKSQTRADDCASPSFTRRVKKVRASDRGTTFNEVLRGSYMVISVSLSPSFCLWLMTIADVALFPSAHRVSTKRTSARPDTSGQSISQLQMLRRIFLYIPMKISSREDVQR